MGTSKAESFKSADAAGTLATMAPEVIRGSFNVPRGFGDFGPPKIVHMTTKPNFDVLPTPLGRDIAGPSWVHS